MRGRSEEIPHRTRPMVAGRVSRRDGPEGSMDMRTERCPGCGALVSASDNPSHPYIGASPGCWAVYGEVLEREYDDYARHAPVHRLSVDAYAAQHPGEPSPRSIASVGVHLVRLYLLLERGLPPERANAAMKWASRKKREFVWLVPPYPLGEVTVLHVHEAKSPVEHAERVHEWARSVWEAWSPRHETIRRWAAG